MTTLKGGDRRTLTSLELIALDEKVVPTARRWLREFPHLSHHAVNTLSHWGEPLVDDQGNNFYPKRMDAAE